MSEPVYDDDDLPSILAERFLPGDLPNFWVILPRRILNWAGVNILLLGAAIGSVFTALIATFVPIDSLTWVFPALLALAYLIRKFLITPRELEAIEQAHRALGSPEQSP